MTQEQFQEFTKSVDWTFAKSVPNWPHFYIVEEELADRDAYQAARAFIRDAGRDGKFFDMDVRYFDTDGWTYWASPLAETFEAKYMLNRCKTDYTYESLAAAGALPAEGFQGSGLDLTPILEDPDFMSLVRDAKGGEIIDSDRPGTVDSENRPGNVPSWLTERRRLVLERHPKTFHSLSYMLELEAVKGQCSDVEFDLLESILAEQ